MQPEPHQLTLVRAIEERACNAWPAFQTLVAGGWLLRFADGYTKRANSICAWRPEASIESVILHAAPLYVARNLPLIVRLSPLAGDLADAALEARGLVRHDETIVMTAALEAASPDAGLVIAPEPTAAWLAGFAAANGVSAARRAVHDRMLAMIPAPAAFASLQSEGRTIAWGVAVAERGMVGLFDIATLPAARRQGSARRLVRGLLNWAKAEAASTAYLQVVATNSPAIALYAGLGFAELYRYHYRITQAGRT